MTRVLAGGLLLLLGCGGPAPPPARPAPATTQPAPPPVPPPVVEAPQPSPCDGVQDDVVVLAPPVSMVCADGHRECTAEVRITVQSCSPEPVEIVVVRAAREDGAEILFEPESPTLAPGASWDHVTSVIGEGTWAVEAELRRGATTGRTAPVELVVDNPALRAAREACDACNGEWGAHGMLGLLGCNCRTADAGRECRDADECEGACLFERFEVVQRASRRCSGGTCNVTLAMGRPVGRCAEWRATFGCRARLRSGAAADPPVPLPGRAPVVCVD